MTDPLSILRYRLRMHLDTRAPFVWRITPDEMRLLLDALDTRDQLLRRVQVLYNEPVAKTATK